MRWNKKLDRKCIVIAIGKLKRDKNGDGQIDRFKIKICIAIVRDRDRMMEN